MKKLSIAAAITLLILSTFSLLGCQQNEGTDMNRPSTTDLSDSTTGTETELPQTI